MCREVPFSPTPRPPPQPYSRLLCSGDLSPPPPLPRLRATVDGACPRGAASARRPCETGQPSRGPRRPPRLPASPRARRRRRLGPVDSSFLPPSLPPSPARVWLSPLSSTSVRPSARPRDRVPAPTPSGRSSSTRRRPRRGSLLPFRLRAPRTNPAAPPLPPPATTRAPRHIRARGRAPPSTGFSLSTPLRAPGASEPPPVAPVGLPRRLCVRPPARQARGGAGGGVTSTVAHATQGRRRPRPPARPLGPAPYPTRGS